MIGNRIIELDTVDSTNNYANRIFGSGAFEDGVVINARQQLAGRGQQDHGWTGEAGKNLTLTVCLRPRFLAPDRQFQLNKAIALGVLDFIRSYMLPAHLISHAGTHIKWPNDIYLGYSKIGGILIENKIMGPILESSIAGIGVNINQTTFPPDIPNPVSLVQLLGHETDLKDALFCLCRFLDRRYSELRKGEPGKPDPEFDENLMGFDQWRNFMIDGLQTEGRIRGVDSFGRLLIEFLTGEIRPFSHREVEYIL